MPFTAEFLQFDNRLTSSSFPRQGLGVCQGGFVEGALVEAVSRIPVLQNTRPIDGSTRLTLHLAEVGTEALHFGLVTTPYSASKEEDSGSEGAVLMRDRFGNFDSQVAQS